MTGLLPPGWRLASVAFGPRGFELRLDGPLSTVGIICELRELSRAWWGALGRAWLVERGETLVEHVPSPREHVHARAERSKRSTCFGCALDRLDSDDHAPRVVVERALGMTAASTSSVAFARGTGRSAHSSMKWSSSALRSEGKAARDEQAGARAAARLL